MFADRHAPLTRAERNVLIMVDGKKTLAQLLVAVPPGESIESLAGHLLELMCIEATGTVATNGAAAQITTPQTPGPVDKGLEAGKPMAQTVGLPFAEVRKLASRMLTDQLGPQSEMICIAIEKSKTPQDLMAAIERGANALSRVKGQSASHDYLAATAERLA